MSSTGLFRYYKSTRQLEADAQRMRETLPVILRIRGFGTYRQAVVEAFAELYERTPNLLEANHLVRHALAPTARMLAINGQLLVAQWKLEMTCEENDVMLGNDGGVRRRCLVRLKGRDTSYGELTIRVEVHYRVRNGVKEIEYSAVDWVGDPLILYPDGEGNGS